MSNLPWFKDLTFQAPMQYWPLQHSKGILLSSPDTSTAKHFFLLWLSCFIFSGTASWCPALFHSSILDTFWSGELIFWCHIFMPFYTVYGVLKASESALPFPPPVDHVLSELSTIICPSWMVLHSVTNSFTELCKPLRHDKAVIYEGVSAF